jgi:integrase
MAKEKTTGNLQRRGRQYWLKMAIPPSLRRFFLSSTRRPMDQIQQALGSDYEAARIECGYRVATYRELFARLRRDPSWTPEQVGKVLREPYAIGEEDNIPADPWEEDPREVWRNRQQRFSRRFGGRNIWEVYGQSPTPDLIDVTPAPTSVDETVSQAAERFFRRLEQKGVRASTLKDRKDHVRSFVAYHGDKPWTEVTKPMAVDWRDSLDVGTSRQNAYVDTLSGVFKNMVKHEEDSPFHGLRLKVAKGERVKRDRYAIEEMQTLFDAFPVDTNPTRHTDKLAVGWAIRIAAYHGMCLEETCQLTLDDIRQEPGNGDPVTIFDVHNGDADHKIKNDEGRPRYVPVHSALWHAGLFEYVGNLRRQGHTRLFPSLKRRPSKGDKWGCNVGDMFNKTRRKLGIERKGMMLDFHSFRTTANVTMKNAGVPTEDRERVLGHEQSAATQAHYLEGYRVTGEGLAICKGAIEKIRYEGLRP